MTAAITLADRTRTRREVDLRDPVAAWLQSRRDAACVADEVDAGAGVADVVAAYGGVAHDRAVSRAFRYASLRTRHEVDLFLYLTRPRPESELKAWAPWGWKGLREQALTPLIKRNIVHQVEGLYQIVTPIPDPGTDITAVELKLKDWRRAVGQAVRYQLFAHEVYVALPVRHAARSLPAAQDLGIGVLGIADDNTVIELLPASYNEPLDDTSRRLAAEISVSSSWSTPRLVGGSPRR